MPPRASCPRRGSTGSAHLGGIVSSLPSAQSRENGDEKQPLIFHQATGDRHGAVEQSPRVARSPLCDRGHRSPFCRCTS